MFIKMKHISSWEFVCATFSPTHLFTSASHIWARPHDLMSLVEFSQHLPQTSLFGYLCLHGIFTGVLSYLKIRETIPGTRLDTGK